MLLQIIAFLLATSAFASVFEFPVEGNVIAGAKQGGFFHISENLIASEQLKGSIDLHVNLERSEAKTKSFAELILIPSANVAQIGSVDSSGKKLLCCTSDRVGTIAGCETAGTLIVDPALSPVRKTVNLAQNVLSTPVEESFELTESGVFNLIVSKCESTEDSLSVTGSVDLRNGHGLLPMKLFINVPIGGILAASYFIFALIWLYWSFQAKLNLISVQKIYGSFIVISTFAALFLCISVADFNASGRKSTPLFLTSNTFNALRHLMVRVLLFLIATGYSFIEKRASFSKSVLISFSLLFFSVRMVFDLVLEGFLSSELKPYVATLLFAFDLFGLVYMDRKLTKLVSGLQKSDESVKATWIRRFVTLFSNGSLILGASAIIHLVLTWNNWSGSLALFVADTVIFELLFIVGILYTGYLLRPTQNSKLYSEFSQLSSEENLDDEEIELPENIDDLGLENDDDLEDIHITDSTKLSKDSAALYKVVNTVA